MECYGCHKDLNPDVAKKQTELRFCENCGAVFCNQCPGVMQNMEICPKCGRGPTHPIAYNGRSIMEEILDLLRGK